MAEGLQRVSRHEEKEWGKEESKEASAEIAIEVPKTLTMFNEWLKDQQRLEKGKVITDKQVTSLQEAAGWILDKEEWLMDNQGRTDIIPPGFSLNDSLQFAKRILSRIPKSEGESLDDIPMAEEVTDEEEVKPIRSNRPVTVDIRKKKVA